MHVETQPVHMMITFYNPNNNPIIVFPLKKKKKITPQALFHIESIYFSFLYSWGEMLQKYLVRFCVVDSIGCCIVSYTLILFHTVGLI